MVLTILPLVMIFALNFVAPDYLSTMAKDPDGKYMIVAAVIFQILGYLIMRKIVNIKVWKPWNPYLFPYSFFAGLLGFILYLGYRFYARPGRVYEQLGGPASLGLPQVDRTEAAN